MSADKEKKLKTSKSRSETAVQGTNDSSIVSKCSMAAQGYFDDPYLQNFVVKVTRRAPLIHRGYYMRAKTLDFLVKKFLHTHKGRKQIISLGAGFDSAYFRLTSQGLLDETVYCEIDFPEVVKRKHALIMMKDVLSQMLQEPVDARKKSEHIELCSENYKLLGVDLSQVNTVEAVLKLCDVDFDVPTLLLSEIVLTYMHRRCASSVIRWAAKTFSNSVFVMYEQINPDDAFGLFMQKHYNFIGSPLKCINTFPTMQSQKDRFRKLGWTYCEAVDMNTFYQDIVSGKEKDRVENLEPFDEYEDFNLKCSHYMMLCAYNGKEPYLLSHISDQSENATEREDIPIFENCIKLSPTKDVAPFCRFGHVTTSLDPDWLLSLGGFGEQEGKHMRVTDITLINVPTQQCVTADPKVNNKETEVSRMHGTVVCLRDGTILLIGGRLSPMRLCTQMVALKGNCGMTEISDILQCTNINDVKMKTQSRTKDSESLLEKDLTKENNLSRENKCEPSDRTKCVLRAKEDFENPEMNEENGICDKEMIETQEQDANMNSQTCSNESMPDAVSQKSLPGATRLTNSHDTVNNSKCLSGHAGNAENANSDAQANTGDKTAGDDFMGKGENKRGQDKQRVKVEFPVTCHVVNQKGEVPCPRWRHTALVVGENGKERIILFGGRTQNILALNDCFSYDTASCIWTKVSCSGNAPSCRHSHTASLWNGHMIIAGGLGEDLQPLNSVHMLNLETLVWHTLKCKMPSRYSHTASVIKDFLVLIGGVSFSHRTLGVSVIHLPTAQCMEFSLPAAKKEELVMLHNHTSVAIDNNRILILGGGGNCFSFGTHLNSSPIIMDLTEAFQIVDAHLANL